MLPDLKRGGFSTYDRVEGQGQPSPTTGAGVVGYHSSALHLLPRTYASYACTPPTCALWAVISQLRLASPPYTAAPRSLRSPNLTQPSLAPP